MDLMLKHLIKIAVALLIACPVAALAQPLIQPTRDVVVTYRISGQGMVPPGQPSVETIRIGFAAHAQRTYVEPVGQPYRMIADRASGHMTMIMLQQHMYMEMPYDQSKVMNFSTENAKFQRKGMKTIAGLSCTEYDVQSPRHNGTACLTDDGVLLQAEGQDANHDGSMEATVVSYGPIPDNAFAPPPDFQKMDMARMGGAMHRQ
ncbi:MAG TPA: DUF4412 domain-containing protein [Rhodopila sp.]|uniref:DUF4412 domain-containing protein n=1 Tax=Rhodopila sp. TaxID=2480087 RepID=UPI002CB0A43A|nr:DUF4412 domain-containing protein [Rhodopila sp.]HVY14478.1 DUF4412 domain-containing protein [Rhodopila sp.]